MISVEHTDDGSLLVSREGHLLLVGVRMATVGGTKIGSSRLTDDMTAQLQRVDPGEYNVLQAF